MLCSSLVCFNTSHWSVSASRLCIANQYNDITCLNVTFTATQCSAGKSEAVVLAPSTALRFAAALCQLLTTLGNCPENVPQTIFFSPTPLCRILYFWFMYCWLTPAAACLIGSTLVCCSRAPRVGGIASCGLCFLANMSSRASSTPSAVLDLSYIITTNFSRICRSSSSTVNGYWLSLANT